MIEKEKNIFSDRNCNHNTKHTTVWWNLRNEPYLHQQWVSGEEMSHWDIIWHPLQCWIQSHYNWKGRRKFVRKRTHKGGTRTHCVNLLPWWRRYKFVFVLKGLFIHELYINSPFSKSRRHWQCAALSDASYRNCYPGFCLYSLIYLLDVKLYVRSVLFGQTFTLYNNCHEDGTRKSRSIHYC